MAHYFLTAKTDDQAKVQIINGLATDDTTFAELLEEIEKLKNFKFDKTKEYFIRGESYRFLYNEN